MSVPCKNTAAATTGRLKITRSIFFSKAGHFSYQRTPCDTITTGFGFFLSSAWQLPVALQVSCSDTLQHTRTENSPEGARAKRDTTASMTSSLISAQHTRATDRDCAATRRKGERLKRSQRRKRKRWRCPGESEGGGTLGKQIIGRWKEKEMFSVKENWLIGLLAFLQVKGKKYQISFGGHLRVLITVLMCT